MSGGPQIKGLLPTPNQNIDGAQPASGPGNEGPFQSNKDKGAKPADPPSQKDRDKKDSAQETQKSKDKPKPFESANSSAVTQKSRIEKEFEIKKVKEEKEKPEHDNKDSKASTTSGADKKSDSKKDTKKDSAKDQAGSGSKDSKSSEKEKEKSDSKSSSQKSGDSKKDSKPSGGKDKGEKSSKDNDRRERSRDRDRDRDQEGGRETDRRRDNDNDRGGRGRNRGGRSGGFGNDSDLHGDDQFGQGGKRRYPFNPEEEIRFARQGGTPFNQFSPFEGSPFGGPMDVGDRRLYREVDYGHRTAEAVLGHTFNEALNSFANYGNFDIISGMGVMPFAGVNPMDPFGQGMNPGIWENENQFRRMRR